MSELTAQPPQVVGMVPWLPWPLSAWPWWTEPVRAERLALLRIGVALCLLADIALSYAPNAWDYFGKGGVGDPGIFAWRFEPSRMTWSLLRGVGDGVIIQLALVGWFAATCWLLATAIARLLLIGKDPPADDRTGIALVLWTCALTAYCGGLWAQLIAAGEFDIVAWAVPLGGASLACLFFALELLSRLRDASHRVPWALLLFALAVSLILAFMGFILVPIEVIDKNAWWARLLGSWQDDETLLVTAMTLWITSAFLLLIGCATRLAAVLTWGISLSFAQINPYLDNAGDTIRAILLFYLMLCPCGAVWSVDAWFTRRGKGSRNAVYVQPWPIRLIFVQMILIYFLNGMYKLLGPHWQDGSSLHYVLGELTLTRFSQMALPLPIEMTRVLTWSVVVWEVSFPLLVLWKWPRRFALFFGVLFHVGIFVTLELAGFVPYALCMYLPLLPFERLKRPRPDDSR